MIAIRKNTREELRIERQDHRGHDLMNFRVWHDDGTGEYHPGKQGIAFKAELLLEVLNGLDRVAGNREAA